MEPCGTRVFLAGILNVVSGPSCCARMRRYKDATGMAAEALPPQHVGPHLPPGGWRPSNPGMGKLTGTPSLPTLNNAPKARSPVSRHVLPHWPV